MWVIDTDIALTTFSGARRPQCLRPLARTAPSRCAGLEVVLLSRGNEPIAKAVTGADGRATFAAGLLKGRGAAEAVAVMASDAAKQEFSPHRAHQGRVRPLRPRHRRPRPARPGRRLPLHRARHLSPRRDGAAHGACCATTARRRSKDMPVTLIVKRPDGSEFTRFTAGAAGSGARAPGDRPAEILAPRPLVGRRPHRSQGAAGRPRRVLGRGFRAREAQGRADVRRADPARRPDQRLRRRRPTSSTARRPRASRSRPTCASPSTTSPSPPSPSTASGRRRSARSSSRR